MDIQAKGKEAYLLFHPVAELEICRNIKTIFFDEKKSLTITGISNEIRTKLRDWAVWQARSSCYSQAA